MLQGGGGGLSKPGTGTHKLGYGYHSVTSAGRPRNGGHGTVEAKEF